MLLNLRRCKKGQNVPNDIVQIVYDKKEDLGTIEIIFNVDVEIHYFDDRLVIYPLQETLPPEGVITIYNPNNVKYNFTYPEIIFENYAFTMSKIMQMDFDILLDTLSNTEDYIAGPYSISINPYCVQHRDDIEWVEKKNIKDEVLINVLKEMNKADKMSRLGILVKNDIKYFILTSLSIPMDNILVIDKKSKLYKYERNLLLDANTKQFILGDEEIDSDIFQF